MVYYPSGNQNKAKAPAPPGQVPNVTGYQPPAPPKLQGGGPNKTNIYKTPTRYDQAAPAPMGPPGSSGSSIKSVAPGSGMITRGPMSSMYNPMTQANTPDMRATGHYIPGPPQPGVTASPVTKNPDYNPPSAADQTLDPLRDATLYNPPGYGGTPTAETEENYPSAYNPNAPGNAGPTAGWPQGLPRPPNGVLPGTPAFNQWLRENNIGDKTHTRYQIEMELNRERQGYTDPTSLSPWGDSENYSQYVTDYLERMGLAPGQAPDSFRGDIYGGIRDDATQGAETAAGMVGDFNAEDATQFGALSDYANNLYDEKLGGFSGFDYEGMQEAGIAQAEIAKASAQTDLRNNLAGTGLSGQANAAYASSGLENDYMNARISAVTDPAMEAARLGIQGMEMASSQLTDLYGIQQDTAMGKAGIYGDVFSRGLGTAATAATAAGRTDVEAFLDQQSLYSGLPMEGYDAARSAAQDRNYDIDNAYESSLDRQTTSKKLREQRRERKRKEKADRKAANLQAAQLAIQASA